MRPTRGQAALAWASHVIGTRGGFELHTNVATAVCNICDFSVGYDARRHVAERAPQCRAGAPIN